MKKIKSYTSIWSVEKVIYAINDLQLPFPVMSRELRCLLENNHNSNKVKREKSTELLHCAFSNDFDMRVVVFNN